MNNNRLITYLKKEKILFLLLVMLNCISSIAQKTYTCSGYPAFTYGSGACGTSIQVDAVVPIANSVDYTWYVGTDPNYLNNPQVSSGNNACIPVSTPNILYYITLVLDDQANNSLNYSTCSYTVPSSHYVKGIDPSTPIKKAIDTHLPVGTIKGSNSVSLTGAASYDIPIAIPKGTAGVEPTLGVNYSSQGGVGLLGMGWNLSVGSSITRTNKDYYNDEYPSAPIGASSDAYALDGNRLVLLSGKYGEDGSVYGTKSETFSRITLYVPHTTQTGVDDDGNPFTYNVNGDPYFIVETKNGMTMEYGYAKDAVVASPIAAWLLNKVQDPNGNYIEYKYTKKGTEVLLSEINYTGNENQGIKPYNQIKFAYATKFDKNIGYPISSSQNSV